MFFKRLGKGSRSNSYAEHDFEHTHSYPQDRELESLSQAHNTYPPGATKESQRPDSRDAKMPYRQTAPPADPYNRPSAAGLNGTGIPARGSLSLDGAGKLESAPDLLTQAFNQAVRPYTDKIEVLEAELADLRTWVETLERERSEMHSWIDKRGLRPDVPQAIAAQMDASPNAATSLNAQLDRKITIVNFDLHRLQDDLNSSISTAHFSSAMSKFLPDIARLSALAGGAKLSFDLILKLGGNLNSHGGLDSNDPDDLNARRDFYAKLDGAMVDVVRRRFEEEGEDNAGWSVGREIKRIEKTAAYLRNFGVEPYFPRTLDAMRRETEFRNAGVGANAAPGHGGSPPRY